MTLPTATNDRVCECATDVCDTLVQQAYADLLCRMPNASETVLRQQGEMPDGMPTYAPLLMKA